MSITFVRSALAQNVDTHVVHTAAADFRTCDLLVAALINASGKTTTLVTDSLSNIWTPISPVVFPGGSRLTLVYAKNPTVGAAQVFSSGDAGDVYSPAIAVMGFAGTDPIAPYDTHHSEFEANTASISPGSITPVNAGSVIVAAVSIGGFVTQTIVPVGGFVTPPPQLTVGGPSYGIAITYLIQTTIAASNPNFLGPDFQCCAQASFAPFVPTPSSGGGTVRIYSEF